MKTFLLAFLFACSAFGAQQVIINAPGNPGGTNDTLKTAFDKINNNFTNLFSSIGATGDNSFTTNSAGQIKIVPGKTAPAWVDVTSSTYGALADGTDDAPEIQAAINFAESQSIHPIVYLPRGTYSITNTLTITNSNLEIWGDGPLQTIIKGNRTGMGAIFKVNNANARLFNVNFHGLQLMSSGLASPPDGIQYINCSQIEFFNLYGTGLNYPIFEDGCEIVKGHFSIFSQNAYGGYWTRQNSSGFGYANFRGDNLVYYQNTNATFKIDCAFSEWSMRDSWVESSQIGWNLSNRSTTDMEGDLFHLDNVHFQNITGSGFEGGRAILAQANGLSNYFILQNFIIGGGSKFICVGSSNAIEFIKGSNTNANTAFHNVHLEDSMFPNVTVGAVYSDSASIDGNHRDLWVQGGLPKTTGSGDFYYRFDPSGFKFKDTNNSYFSAESMTAGNDRLSQSASTNSSYGFNVPDSTKNFYWQINGTLLGTLDANTFAYNGMIDLKERGSDPASPAATYERFYAKSTGLFVKNSAGTVTGPFGSGGSVYGDGVLISNPNFRSGTNILLIPSVTTNLDFVVTNIDASKINSGTLTVSRGGSGAATFTANGVLMGNGTSAFGVSAAGTAGAPFLSGGAGVNGAYGALNLAGGSSTVTGVLPVANYATGTPTGSKFVRDDGTLQIPPGSGDVVAASNNSLTGSNNFGGVTVFNGPMQETWTNLAGGTVLDYAGKPNVIKPITANLTLTSLNEVNDRHLRVLGTNDATGGYSITFNLTGATLFVNATNQSTTPPNFPTNAGAVWLVEIYRILGTNYITGPSAADSKLLTYLANTTGNGILTKTASDTILGRTIIGTANEITFSNGDGISGNPIASLPSSLTFTGKTITGGTYVSPGGLVTSVTAGHGLQTYSGTAAITSSDTAEIGFQVNAQSGTTYTVTTNDWGKMVTTTNASAIAVTLPQASSTTFQNGFVTMVRNIGPGLVTITPTTSKIDNGTTITLANGFGSIIVSDGTNYWTKGLPYNGVDLTTVQTLQNKTINTTAAGGNNTLKEVRSLKFTPGSFVLVDNAGCTIPNTNDYTLNTFMVPQFSGSGASNANFMRFMCRVPKDIDTSVAMLGSLTVELTAADTGAQIYHVGVVSVANSAVIAGTAANYIVLNIAADASGASTDVESVNNISLTGWAGALTANQWMVIELRRDGTDASTIASRFRELEIFYNILQ